MDSSRPQNSANYPYCLVIISLILLCMSASSCVSGNPQYKLLLENGKEIELLMAIDAKSQMKGLSGLTKTDFNKNQGMLFINDREEERQFWMPDTYFNLDIFFLDNNLKVLAVDRNMIAHPGRQVPPTIMKTNIVSCYHVLEMRADSQIAKEIKEGSKLTFLGPKSIKRLLAEGL